MTSPHAEGTEASSTRGGLDAEQSMTQARWDRGGGQTGQFSFARLAAPLTRHRGAGHDAAFAFVSRNECEPGGLTISRLSAAKTCFRKQYQIISRKRRLDSSADLSESMSLHRSRPQEPNDTRISLYLHIHINMEPSEPGETASAPFNLGSGCRRTRRELR